MHPKGNAGCVQRMRGASSANDLSQRGCDQIWILRCNGIVPFDGGLGSE